MESFSPRRLGSHSKATYTDPYPGAADMKIHKDLKLGLHALPGEMKNEFSSTTACLNRVSGTYWIGLSKLSQIRVRGLPNITLHLFIVSHDLLVSCRHHDLGLGPTVRTWYPVVVEAVDSYGWSVTFLSCEYLQLEHTSKETISHWEVFKGHDIVVPPDSLLNDVRFCKLSYEFRKKWSFF